MKVIPMPNNQHVVILPYFCDDEIKRYLKIADKLRSFPQPDADVHYLLACSPRRSPSPELYAAYSELAPCTSFQCPTQVFGYPQGPTAMYWDAMEFIAKQFAGNDGFSLWLESDMAPIKPNWIDRLSAEWYDSQPPLMMGCYVPEVYKHRLFRRPKLLLQPHVNGGACYATDFAKRMPSEARDGVFDMAVYQHASEKNQVRPTRQISFSTLGRVRRDLLDPEKVLLHGFMQDKDPFIEACLKPVTHREQASAAWIPMRDRMENLRRRVRVCFVRRGHRAMFENMLLAKSRMESQNRAA